MVHLAFGSRILLRLISTWQSNSDHACKADHHGNDLKGKQSFSENDPCKNACPETTRLKHDYLECQRNQHQTIVEQEKSSLASETSPEHLMLEVPGECLNWAHLDTTKLNWADDKNWDVAKDLVIDDFCSLSCSKFEYDRVACSADCEKVHENYSFQAIVFDRGGSQIV